jgi:GNAT superfamily N-acetyltransferase
MEQTTIRPACDIDLPDVVALSRHLNPADPVLDPARAAMVWSALLGSGLTTVFVAEVAGRLAATCTLVIVPNLTRGGRSFGVIENVVTAPEKRRTGLARRVLTAALDAAWDAGCYKVSLASGRDEPTLRFYETCGFKRGGKTHFEVRRP